MSELKTAKLRGMTGKHHSEATTLKISETRKKRFAEGKIIPYLLGKHRLDETKRKISIAHKGKKLSEEHKRKLSLAHKGMFGRHHSEETKQKLRDNAKNDPNWGFKGKHHSEEHKKYLSLLYQNEKSTSWKGDKVGYGGVHKWVRKNKPKPEFCEECNENSPYDLANISGEYKRDINDYRWLCRSCHKKEHFKNKTWKITKIIYKIMDLSGKIGAFYY